MDVVGCRVGAVGGDLWVGMASRGGDLGSVVLSFSCSSETLAVCVLEEREVVGIVNGAML